MINDRSRCLLHQPYGDHGGAVRFAGGMRCPTAERGDSASWKAAAGAADGGDRVIAKATVGAVLPAARGCQLAAPAALSEACA